jgi:hypothetical protein
MLYHNTQPHLLTKQQNTQKITPNTKTNLQHKIIHQLRLTRRDCTQRWTYNSNAVFTASSFLLFLPLCLPHLLPFSPLPLPNCHLLLSSRALISQQLSDIFLSWLPNFITLSNFKIVFRRMSRHSYPLLWARFQIYAHNLILFAVIAIVVIDIIISIHIISLFWIIHLHPYLISLNRPSPSSAYNFLHLCASMSSLAPVSWFIRPVYLSGSSPFALLLLDVADIFYLRQECHFSCLLSQSCQICCYYFVKCLSGICSLCYNFLYYVHYQL